MGHFYLHLDVVAVKAAAKHKRTLVLELWIWQHWQWWGWKARQKNMAAVVWSGGNGAWDSGELVRQVTGEMGPGRVKGGDVALTQSWSWAITKQRREANLWVLIWKPSTYSTEKSAHHNNCYDILQLIISGCRVWWIRFAIKVLLFSRKWI